MIFIFPVKYGDRILSFGDNRESHNHDMYFVLSMEGEYSHFGVIVIFLRSQTGQSRKRLAATRVRHAHVVNPDRFSN